MITANISTCGASTRLLIPAPRFDDRSGIRTCPHRLRARQYSQGNFTRGIAELERGLHLMRDAPRVKAHLAYAHAVSGSRDRATACRMSF